ncbi:MAG: type II toxin-antitoxin system death-on-curing family toxin [Candidatus Levyibacteriota bacterium]|nr:MAG: type II toxin-antitoxin system death-on-curing family toxin [Candidatus Levybacteria bacterium]
MKGITYITLDVVLAIHDDMVERYGGSHGIKDLGLIQSALARPQASFGGEDLYPTILDKAAALFHSLIFNHAFTDGNKRTSITTTARFLYINGYEFKVDKKELIDFPLRVENKHLTIVEIAKWLKTHARKKR